MRSQSRPVGLRRRLHISQPTLSRIITGERSPKVPELAVIAWAAGMTLAETGGVAERVQCAARATDGAGMEQMRAALLHFGFIRSAPSGIGRPWP